MDAGGEAGHNDLALAGMENLLHVPAHIRLGGRVPRPFAVRTVGEKREDPPLAQIGKARIIRQHMIGW